ncbi:MAG: hypothetical protein IKN63_02780 [Bacilli bacterium]|nr:hypothetical protein [Bacilli bacterium]
MKKLKYILMFILMTSVLNVKAIDSCTTDEMTRLKELANNVEIKYSYEIITDENLEDDEETEDDSETDEVEEEDKDIRVLYKIDAYNLTDDLRLYFADDLSAPIDISNIKSYEFYEGENINIKIYSHTVNLCTDRVLRNIKIDLPIYNRYYYENKEKCSKTPEFKYCQEFLDVTMESSEIDKLYDKYVQGMVIEEIKETVNYNIYYIIIGLIIIVISIIFIIIKIRANKKKLKEFR